MKEKALLITVCLYSKKDKDAGMWTPEERAGELIQLAESAGAEVVHSEVAALKEISAAYYIGSGKAEEIKHFNENNGVNVVIFNNDLSPSQQQNLEDIVGAKVIDRTQLILDIFARRARSNEGKIQVELAQLMYLLPRLGGKGVMLSRLGGGIGTRGPGEQKLEIDRRRIREKIDRLKRELEDIKRHRHTRRANRSDFSMLSAALIGYTNAGKSTLLNTLTGAGVKSEDRLFSTLDPTTRSLLLPNNQNVTLSDTVGFLDHLPHHLVESFKATLEEVIEADLLIHVIDASHPKKDAQINAVKNVLIELGAEKKDILEVYNKIDKMNEDDVLRLGRTCPGAAVISCLTGAGITGLLEHIERYAAKNMVRLSFDVPQHNMKVINFMHTHAHIIKKEYLGADVHFEAEIPSRFETHLKNILSGRT